MRNDEARGGQVWNEASGLSRRSAAADSWALRHTKHAVAKQSSCDRHEAKTLKKEVSDATYFPNVARVQQITSISPSILAHAHLLQGNTA